jgi:lysophospholipase L1-like esterase
MRSFLGVLLALALAELFLRCFHYARPVRDPIEGMVFRSQTVRMGLGEGSSFSHWNADGARVGPPAAAGAPRVLALGDSFTEALQVRDEQTFTAIAQEQLTRSGMAVRIVNLGRSVRSPADYVAQAPYVLRKFRPRWTIVEVNEPDLGGDSFDRWKTHFVRTPSGLRAVEVTPYESRRVQMIRDTLQSSALADRLIRKASMYRQSARMPPLFRAADLRRYEASLPESELRRWPAGEILDRLTAAYAGRVTFLFLPPFNTGTGVAETQFLDWCRGRSASCVDLHSVFEQFRAEGKAPYGFANGNGFGAGHLNPAGHAAAARLLAAELQRVRQRGLF